MPLSKVQKSLAPSPRLRARFPSHEEQHVHLLKRMMRGMRAQASLFRSLRKPLPPESDLHAVVRKIDAIEKKLMQRKIPRRARNELLAITHQVRKQAEQLAQINSRVQSGNLSVGKLMHTILAHYSDYHATHHSPAELAKVKTFPGIRFSADYAGLHFVIPEKLYPVFENFFKFEEGGFNGVSFGAYHLSIHSPRGKPTEFEYVPVSISVEGNGNDLRGIKRHEKWHDFESLRSSTKEFGIKKMKGKPIHEVIRFFDGWWRNELSASIMGGQTSPSPREGFALRLLAYSKEITALLRSEGRPPEEMAVFQSVVNRYSSILREVVRLQYADPLHQSKKSSVADNQLNRLILAGIISYSPSARVEARLHVLSAFTRSIK